MTEEFKKNILDYVVGKIQKNEKKDGPQIASIVEVENKMESFIKKFYPELTLLWDASIITTRGDYIILFCNDYIDEINSEKYGHWCKTFILVLDKKYTPIKFIDSYESGTAFNVFSKLNENDEGTGNLYMLDTVLDEKSEVVKRRICIINDFTLTDFNVKLLNSYEIPKYNDYIVGITQFFKSSNEGKYFMLYRYNIGYNDDFSTIDKGGVLEFVNNVGSSNEWNFYPYNGEKNINWYGYAKGIPKWTSEGLQFKIFCDHEVEKYNNNSIAFLILENNENECVETKDFNLPDECKNVGQLVSNCVVSNKILLETQTTFGDLEDTKYIIEYDLNDYSYKIRYLKEDYIYLNGDDYYESSYDNFTIFTIGTDFYFFKNYRYHRTSTITWEEEKVYNNDLILYQITNDKVYEFYVKNLIEYDDDLYYSLSTDLLYNLRNFHLFFHNRVLNIKQIFNQNNYNGKPYTNVNLMVANDCVLYDEENTMIFARNLYNKKVNDNITISTLEIPNNYLNEDLITKQELISQNKNVIEKKENVLRKNLYETLFINFINSINVVNENNNQKIYNRTASINLNKSINNPINYEDIKLNKFKVSYDDGTEFINFVDVLKEGTHYNLKCIFYIEKTASELSLISNDEKTKYITIDNSNLEKNKYYSLKQRIKIEN